MNRILENSFLSAVMAHSHTQKGNGYGFGSQFREISSGLIYGYSCNLKKYSHCTQKGTHPCASMATIPFSRQGLVRRHGSWVSPEPPPMLADTSAKA